METLHRNGSDVPTVTIRFPKRVHFSLRGLLVATAFVAIGTYWFVVRPSMIANRFVIAMTKEDYETAQSMYIDKEIWPLAQGPHSATVDNIYAELLPREWGDIWRGRRRILLTYHYQDVKDGRQVDWTTASDLVAKPYGIEETKSNTWQLLL
jgi:hypothetical protein